MFENAHGTFEANCGASVVDDYLDPMFSMHARSNTISSQSFTSEVITNFRDKGAQFTTPISI